MIDRNYIPENSRKVGAKGMLEEVMTVMKSLENNLFSVKYTTTIEEATSLALELIPLEAKVGLGGSTSIKQSGLVKRLKERGTTVLDTTGPRNMDPKARRQALRDSDVFLASCNAITLDGKLVNIDGSGKRVANTIFGPKQVILIVGTNKIVSNIDEAIDRIKNVIAPYHNMARKRKVPCAVSLRCTDCDSPDRSCRITVIMEKQPRQTDITVLLVGEDMGLGWDSNWVNERKEKIATVYRKFLFENY